MPHLKLSASPRGNGFDSRDDAERFVEVFCPCGYLYEVVEISKSRLIPACFAVKVYNKNVVSLGYASGP